MPGCWLVYTAGCRFQLWNNEEPLRWKTTTTFTSAISTGKGLSGSLAGLRPGDDAARELVQTLDEIDQAETDDATLVVRIPEVGEVLVQVLVEPNASTIGIVRVEHIPEPWRSRFLAASIGSTRVVEGFYAHDWHSFLRKWQAEMCHVAEHRTARCERE